MTELKEILLRLGTDEELRKKFFGKERENIISRYKLTEKEKRCLRELSEKQLTARISKAQLGCSTTANDIRI